MQRISLGDWVLECDSRATQRAHADRSRGASDRCACTSCRNFTAARTLGLEPELRQLLAQLGVPPDRETEIRDDGPSTRSGFRRYRGSYHAIGRIVHDPLIDQDPPGSPVIELPHGVRIFIADGVVAAPPGFGTDVLQVEFTAEVPWLLEEAQPDAADDSSAHALTHGGA